MLSDNGKNQEYRLTSHLISLNGHRFSNRIVTEMMIEKRGRDWGGWRYRWRNWGKETPEENDRGDHDVVPSIECKCAVGVCTSTRRPGNNLPLDEATFYGEPTATRLLSSKKGIHLWEVLRIFGSAEKNLGKFRKISMKKWVISSWKKSLITQLVWYFWILNWYLR